MFERYREWKKRRRAVREARLLLRESRRALRKFAHRLSPQGSTVVRESIEGLKAALASYKHDKKVSVTSELNALDKALDDYMPFARKSTIREYTESIAVAVLIALFLRAFVVEAFKIPSGSMIPTLEVGDHIFVNKFIYGIRIPFTNIKIGDSYRKPRRGEVVVFIYPKEPDKDFIKRIVAIEGDTVEVRDNVLYVNDKAVDRRSDGECDYWDYNDGNGEWHERSCDRFVETVNGHPYNTVYDRHRGPSSSGAQKVPHDTVFVMGDNRDNSHDSRAWGFVPLSNIKGKAMVIWWSTGKPEDFVRLRRLFHFVE